MVNLYIIAIGKLKEAYLRDACAEYIKRLSAFCKCVVIELPEGKLSNAPSNAEIERCIQEEGKRILAKLPPSSYIYSLCIEGKQLSSPKLAEQLQRLPVEGKSHIAFLIGGSYGLSDEVKRLSHFRLSMSEMTFPHQLARVMLLEQLYRAFQINGNGKYHK